MAMTMYLGAPPASVVRWVENRKSGEAERDPRLTYVRYTKESGLPDWSGDLTGRNLEGSLMTQEPTSEIPNLKDAVEVFLGQANLFGSTFFQCENLTSVVMCDGYQDVPAYFLYGCTKLTSVTIPSSVASIGGNAFTGTKIETMDLNNLDLDFQWPPNVPVIGEYAFRDSSVRSIDISRCANATIQNIGFYNEYVHSFDYADNLVEIICSDGVYNPRG